MLVIRCKEQPDSLVARSVNCAVLMLLPGPREHCNMNSVFKLVAEDMARLQNSGMQVSPVPLASMYVNSCCGHSAA